MKKTERQSLIDALDAIVSKIIILRDGSCVLCGFDCASENHPTPKGSILTNGHIFSRKNKSVRWDISPKGDCHCQCWACNFRHIHDQYPYFKWYIDKFGQEEFDKLRQRAKTSKKWKIYELKEELERLNLVYRVMLDKKQELESSRVNAIRTLDDKVKSLYR